MSTGEIRTDNVHVIDWKGERAVIGPWRGDAEIAYLTSTAGGSTPSVDFVRRCLDELRRLGYTRVVTGALSPLEQTAYLSVGFDVAEQLSVLAHDLAVLPAPGGQPDSWCGPGRARRHGDDRRQVLAVDHAAFRSFWRLDSAGLDEAMDATPHSRLRVARTGASRWLGPRPPVVGYAVTGHTDRQGFLQRLAVDPRHQREGIGRALTLDSLRWLRRSRVERALVNTQPDNLAAIHLYESMGFRRQKVGLCVLRLDLR